VSFHRYLLRSRTFLALAAVVAVMSLVPALDAAETVAKKKVTTPGYDDPSIGVLGAHHSASDGATPVNRNAAPPAPIAAPALPKVDSEAPVISGPGSGPTSLTAVPRPEAHVEGTPTTNGQAVPVSAPAQQVNSFLASQPVISGLIAGLIGTDLGSILYGGSIMGDETAAMIGYLVRVVLIVLVAILAVRFIWGLIGGSRDADDEFLQRGPRREPSFGRSEDSGDGRREPTFGGARSSYKEERPRRL
jgi:hypothetical protein